VSNLAKSLNIYMDWCSQKLVPLLDKQPWTAVAVNPAPNFRAVISEAESSSQFITAAKALDEHLGDQRLDEDFAVEGTAHARHHWHLSAFLWNAGVYDSLIRGERPNGKDLADAIVHEASRTDTTFKHAAFLESFASETTVNVGAFSIRHLSDQEVKEAFAGRCQLDRREHWPVIQEAMGDAWFAVVEGAARPLEDRITFRGAIGLHDFECSPFRNINLGLNLFKAAPGPVVIRRTFHWNSSLFHRHIEECPRQSDDLYPSSWGGPCDEPPAMRLYRLSRSDIDRLPVFWQSFEKLYVSQRRYAPAYLHRAIDRFLRACKANRADWEFRQFLYVLALEALFSGEESDRVRPLAKRWNRRLQQYETVKKRNARSQIEEEVQIGVANAVTKCSANLIALDRNYIAIIQDWLFRTYKQRSRFAHGSTFEQEEFFAQPQNPDEHEDAKRLCDILNIDASSVWEGPDIGLAVLHNIVRLSLLSFIGRIACLLDSGEPWQIVSELSASKGKTKADRTHRKELHEKLADLQLKDKKEFLQKLHDSFQNEQDRQELRRLCGDLASQTV